MIRFAGRLTSLTASMVLTLVAIVALTGYWSYIDTISCPILIPTPEYVDAETIVEGYCFVNNCVPKLPTLARPIVPQMRVPNLICETENDPTAVVPCEQLLRQANRG
jgi:hypothetical protein